MPYASDTRNEGDRVVGAVEEALQVVRMAGARTQISHLQAQGQGNWWKAEPIPHLLEAAAPTASTSYTSASLRYVRDGSGPGTAARPRSLRASPTRRSRNASGSRYGRRWTSSAIGTSRSSRRRNESLAFARGRRLGALAKERGEEPHALPLRII